jgi:L-lactate dehydrogenase complex protein LldG
MTTREQFIGAISKALGRAELPPEPAPLTYRHTVHANVMKGWSRDDLARAFIEYSKTIGAGICETTREELNHAIREAVAECVPGPVLLANDALLGDLNTVAALEMDRSVRVWNTGDSRENDIAFAEKAAVGIAIAKMALAESATVLLFSHNGCGRSVTLLPESVLYIIPKSLIRPRLTQGMEFLRQNKEQLPSSVNFVSGPSATSDIELIRVVGVHGPMHVVHIVVNDM